jgi:hypothetical protein
MRKMTIEVSPRTFSLADFKLHLNFMFVLLFITIFVPANADDGIRHHQYKPGETINYFYEDTDTTYSTSTRDGTVQAADSVQIQEIQIPVTIKLQQKNNASVRTLTISPEARFRTSSPGALSQTPFQPIGNLIKDFPPFSYSYDDDTQALDHLQDTFAIMRKNEVGNFMFFKVQDIHQMQESAQKIPEGITPGQTHFSPRQQREGLGGKFVAAPGQLIYQGIEILNGEKAAYFKVISLANVFTTTSFKTYTNFSFTMHVALAGPHQGLLLFGEGQETATVFKSNDKIFQPVAVLQRQFSIRLQ